MNKLSNFEARRHARRITEQAAAWYLDQQGHPTECQQGAFLAWLRTSPAHVAEYLAIAQMHGDLKTAASIETLSMVELADRVRRENPVVLFPRPVAHAPQPGSEPVTRAAHRGRAWLRIAATAAVVTLVLLGGMHWRAGGVSIDQRYTADATAITEVSLPDGSLIHLARNSTIHVRFDAHTRRIEVIDGNALFDVGKDPQRPMLVQVDGHVLQDIGTVFDVQRDTHGDTLTVISGRVRVWNAPQAWLGKMKSFIGRPPISGSAVADLTAGERIQLSASSISAIQPATIAQTTAWLPDEIRFQHETVGNVARRFNAYTTTPLVIEDAHIAGLRISGVFHADNPAGFVAYLATLPGVRVVRGDDRVRIVASSADDHVALRRL